MTNKAAEFNFADLAKLPSLVAPQRGVYSGTMSMEIKTDPKTGAESVQVRIQITEIGELDSEADGDVVKLNDIVQVQFGLESENGQGYLRNFLTPFVENGNVVPGPIAEMCKTLTGTLVQMIASAAPSKDPGKFWPRVEQISAV